MILNYFYYAYCATKNKKQLKLQEELKKQLNQTDSKNLQESYHLDFEFLEVIELGVDLP